LALLKPGSLVISNAFAIPGWEATQTLHTDVFMKIPIYIYRI
ncbi:MAG: SAM-dependent methyltransferase, partial [Micavibrio aeruginosavorus]